MYADANEASFARLYLERIVRHAEQAGIVPPSIVLEAGCQTGRLVIPMAQRGFDVTGVDTSGFALRRAQVHAKAAGVSARFVKGDVLDVLRRQGSPQYDLVVCAEVLYLSRQYREILEALARAVRPGGLLCVSHRPKFYYLIEALKQYDLATAQQVLSSGEGPFRGSEYYNWQTEEELRAWYADLGLEWLAVYPIDRLAWLTGTDLAQLTEEARAHWIAFELDPATQGALCARYVFVIARRP